LSIEFKLKKLQILKKNYI